VVGLRAVGRVREVGKERAGSEEIGGNHTIMCNILQIEKGHRREPTKKGRAAWTPPLPPASPPT